jgi:hypothetical protein
MINYQTLPGLAEHLEQNGYRVIKRDGVFVGYDSNGNSSELIDSAINSLIDGYDPIDFVKAEKGDEIKSEGLARISAVFPAINDLDELKLEQERWLSIAPAARQPTTDYQQAIDIYVAARNAITSINSETDWTVVNAYDVVTGPSWPT